MSINNHKIFIFDLDGTIIDSEKIHHEAYNMQLKEKISYDTYCEIFHTSKKEAFCRANGIDGIKKENDFQELYTKNSKFIEGFEEFFKDLIQNGKITCVVTNSSKQRCEFIKSLHPILNYIDLWITKDDVSKPKPSPEGYIKAIQQLVDDSILLEEVVIFEDSLVGLESIRNIQCVSKIFMNTNGYKNNPMCYNNYDNYYQIMQSNMLRVPVLNDDYENIFKKYRDALCLLESYAKRHISIILPLIMNKIVLFIGVGKSHLIAEKCVSTWNSMGISAHTINANNLVHGDFGKIVDNSVIIYISNSGNTQELINVANHIKKEFNVVQITLSNNSENQLKEFCNYNFSLLNDNKIYEIDDINKAPTTSSLVFLTFLDILGIQLRKAMGKFTVEDFIRFHPGGTLGKKNLIDHVVIVACGKGIRLYPYTKDFPKCLVNLDNENILCKQLNYWGKYTNSFVIIIDEKYNNIVEFYCNHMQIEYKIINVSIYNQENSYTIQQGLANQYDNKNIIITWCDILLTHEIDLQKLNTNTIFTYGNECRYIASNNNITKVDNCGNVIGCFFIQNYHKIDIKDARLDFCDVFIDNFGSFNIYQLDDITDIGDLYKLQNYRDKARNVYKTRYFNRISDTADGNIKKQALDIHARKLIANEKKWYKMISTTDIKHLFPSIIEYGSDYFIMEKIDGQPLYKGHGTDLLSIFECLEKIHNCKSIHVSDDTFFADLKIEFYDKIKQRCSNIKTLISYLKISRINNIQIKKNFEEILTSLYDDIVSFYKNIPKIYNIIHGDCQYSNILKTKDKIVFIDPRGYFGKSIFYGIKEYDYSKILYALSGYDKFNNSDYYFIEYDSDLQNINLFIDHNDLLQYRNIFRDFDICLKMVILHWFGLADYNKNNIHKCIASFYQAIYLYHIYCA